MTTRLPGPGGRARRLALAAAVVGATCLAAAGLVLLVTTDAVVRRLAQAGLQRTLGVSVTVGHAELHWDGAPALTLLDVAADPGTGWAERITVGRVEVRTGGLGREAGRWALHLQRVRAADVWVQLQEEEPPEADAPREEHLLRLLADPRTRAGPLDVVPDEVALVGATVVVRTEQVHRPVLEDAELGTSPGNGEHARTWNVTFRAGTRGGGANVRLRATVHAGAADALPGVDAEVEARGVELARLAALAPPGFPVPAAGTADIDADVHWTAEGQSARTQGTARIAGLALADGGAPGRPLNAVATWKADLVDGRPVIHELVLAGDDVRLHVHAGPAPGAFDVRVEADAAGVAQALPPGWLPPGMSLGGRLVVEGRGSAPGGSADVVADALAVEHRGVFRKAAGVPAGVHVEWERRPEVVRLPVIRMRVGALTLEGDAELDADDLAPRALQLDSGALAVADLRGLLPGLDALAGRRRAGGSVRVLASGDRHGARAVVQAVSLAARLDAVDVAGALWAELTARREEDGTVVAAAVRLDDLAVTGRGAHRWAKPRGVPLGVNVEATVHPDHIRVTHARVEAGASTATVSGTAHRRRKGWDIDGDTLHGTVVAESLAPVFAAAQQLPAAARADFSGSFRLPAGNPAGAELRLATLSVRSGANEGTGTLRITGLERPAGELVLRHFHVDQALIQRWAPDLPVARCSGALTLRGRVGEPASVVVLWEGGEARLAGGTLVRGRVAVSGLERPRVQVDVLLDRVDPAHWGQTRAALPAGLQVGGRVRVARVDVDPPVEAVDASFLYRDRKLALQALSLRLLDGRLVADSSTVDLAGEVPAYQVRASVESVDPAPLFNRPGRRALEGRISADLDLRARGATLPALLQSAAGPVAFRFHELVLHRVDLLSGFQLPEGAGRVLAERRGDPEPTVLHDGAGTGTLAGGKLRIVQPVDTRTNFGSLQLAGTIDVHGELDLAGTAELSPDAMERMTRGTFRPRTAGRTPVRLSGRPGEIGIHDVDARMFLKDEEVPTLLEAAGRLAAEGRERARARAAADVARIRERMAQGRQDLDEEARRTADDFRVFLGAPWPTTDGGWPAPPPLP